MNHLHARNIQNIHTVINHVPSSPRYNWGKIKGDNSCNIPSTNKCIIDMTCWFLKNATKNIMKRFQFFPLVCSTYNIYLLSSISLSWWIKLKPDKSGLKKPIAGAAEVNVLILYYQAMQSVAVQGSKLAKSCLNCNKCWLRSSSEDCTTSSVLVLFWHWLGAGCWLLGLGLGWLRNFRGQTSLDSALTWFIRTSNRKSDKVWRQNQN